MPLTPWRRSRNSPGSRSSTLRGPEGEGPTNAGPEGEVSLKAEGAIALKDRAFMAEAAHEAALPILQRRMVERQMTALQITASPLSGVPLLPRFPIVPAHSLYTLASG